MWASPGRNNNNNNNIKQSINNVNVLSRSPPNLLSTCSSPIENLSSRKTMEEVWKDISLASLCSDSATNAITAAANHHPALSSMILQDFLARPFKKLDPPRRGISANDTSLIAEETNFYGSSAAAPPPPTVLSLNTSGSDFQYIESDDPARPNSQLNGHAAPYFGSSRGSIDPLASPPVFQMRPHENDDRRDDRRHKRMIKNRESAARSRARKQAYTTELELEVAHLQKENAKLRRQQEKLFAARTAQIPKKHSLLRTLTAPF